MTTTSRPPAGPDHVLATITRLAAAADGDTLYRDVYLRRAAELLAPIVSETQYEAALTTREQVNAVLAQARGAVGSQDWTKVRELGRVPRNCAGPWTTVRRHSRRRTRCTGRRR